MNENQMWKRAEALARRLVKPELVKLDYKTYHERAVPMIMTQLRAVAKKEKDNPLQPDLGVLCKLGSITVHAEEMLAHEGHNFDRIALESLLKDEEVVAWSAQMTAKALIPKKR